MRKLNTKRGFTLVELIVVLAILAVLTSIGVATAFGSIEKAEDAAAVASLNSIRSVLRSARTLMLADKDMESILSKWRGGFAEYVDGQFRRASTDSGNKYEDYIVTSLQDSKLRVKDKAFIYLSINEGSDVSQPYYFLIYYAPNGGKSGRPSPKLVAPYYRYDSIKDEFVKFKKDGSQEVIE